MTTSIPSLSPRCQMTRCKSWSHELWTPRCPCGERETQQRVFACIVAACTFIAAIDDDNTRNGLIGELRGFVEDGAGIKLARTTRVMAEQGTSYEDACDAAVAAGIEVLCGPTTPHTKCAMPQDGILRGGDGGRAAAQDRPRAKGATRWLQYVSGDIGQLALHCTEKVYYLPSQPQRRGISYAESKTECQPTNHCKLYSSEILDRPRDRKAHGLCPQAQPLRTSRRDHDPGHLSSWTASLGGLRSPMASGRADQGRMHVRRAKNGTPSVHPIRGDEIRALRKLRRENPTEAYVFVTERGGPMSTIGFHHLIQRLGKAAKMPFPLHPHMLRHACGYKLANDGHDTRALQHYLGHKNIQHTVRYTELSPDRFRDFWRD